MTKPKKQLDVAVIGGGPAGMMAAGRAAQLGASVVLIEKNRKLGLKLLMTGGGRCNLTQAEYDTRRLVEKYGKSGKFLFSAFTAFGVKDTMYFFGSRGLALKEEDGGRIFPAADRASDVQKALTDYMKAGNVKVLAGTAVTGIEKEGNRITKVLTSGDDIIASNYIVCTGGKSYPSTGSTGEGFGWVKHLGHNVTKLTPALVPVTVREAWVREVEGASYSGVLNVYQGGKKRASEAGEGVFTHSGLSGPAVLNLSKAIRALMDEGEVKLSLDLMPGVNIEGLDAKVQGIFKDNQNRLIRNCLALFVTPRLVPLVLKLAGMDGDMQVNKASRTGRQALVRTLKGMEMTVKSLGGFEKAMVTAGGVSLKEVDQRTMRSKVIENLYFAGEVLDIDGPTGGYNLQVCWSTGHAAGGYAALD